MIKYRPHLGGLKESLLESREFNSIKDIFQHLVDEMGYGGLKCEITDFNIAYYAYDDRCKQELYIVWINDRPCGFIFEERE